MNKRLLIRAVAVGMSALIIPSAIASDPAPSVLTDRSAFAFGADWPTVRAVIESRFDSYSTPIDQPIEVPTASATQQQVDAFGDSTAEWVEKTEFVFADGELDIVGVLTPMERAKETIDRLATAAVEPTHSIPGAADFYLERGFAARYTPV